MLLFFFLLQADGVVQALTPPSAMTAQAVMTISAAVVLLVQIVKWAGLPDRRGPLAVLALSLLGVAFWGWSKGDFQRATAFDYFAGFVGVAASAAGVFGFTRSMPDAVTKTTSPPTGAGAAPTVRSIIIALAASLILLTEVARIYVFV